MTTANELSVRRCAVCRVNMKCRFVYVDDGVERLLGYTREELFGKSFLDFIDEADRPLFSSILEHRNHFESNFDITALHILTRMHQRIPANVVVSLNFIAGNPVNFQIIIDAGRGDDEGIRLSIVDFDHRRYVGRLLGALSDSYAADVLDALYEYLGDEITLIYQVNGDQVEPIHWRTSGPGACVGKSKEPTALLNWVAVSDEPYSFLDPDNARRAIEKCGSAPSEYINRLRLGGDTYLVRVVLEEIPEPHEQRRAVETIAQAIDLAERLSPNGPQMATDLAVGSSVLQDLKVSLASAMRIAAMLGKTDSASK